MKQITMAAVTLVGCTLIASAAHAGEWSVGVGADVSQGDYGTGLDSTVWSLPFTAQYQGERMGWSLTVPYLIVTGPSSVVVSGGMVQGDGHYGMGGRAGGGNGGGGSGGGGSGGGTGGSSSSTRTVSGIGDVVIGASMGVVEESESLPFLGLYGEVKLATADESRNLGTGANDYALTADAAKGGWSGRVGYRWLGDTSAIDFNNVAHAAVAYTYYGAAGGDLGIEAFGEEARLVGAVARREVTLYGSYPVGDSSRLKGYLLKEFSDASPDVGAGISFISTF